MSPGQPRRRRAARTALRDVWNEALRPARDCRTKPRAARLSFAEHHLARRKEQAIDRLGIIDFQDALIGPSAYDVASLAHGRPRHRSARDRKADASKPMSRRGMRRPDFDEAAFGEAYAIMAAQRNSKILGIFVRLNGATASRPI